MKCRDIRKLLIAFSESELSDGDREGVAAHLRQCEGCRKEKELLESTWAALDGLRAPAVSRDFTPNLMAKIHEQEKKKTEWVFGFPKIHIPFELPRFAPVMVSICFVIAVCFSVPYFLPKETRPAKDQPVDKTAEIRTEEKTILGPAVPAASGKISAADEEIIRNLDVYENMDLLQNYALLSDFDVVQNLQVKAF